jgi:hypothetical protein
MATGQVTRQTKAAKEKATEFVLVRGKVAHSLIEASGLKLRGHTPIIIPERLIRRSPFNSLCYFKKYLHQRVEFKVDQMTQDAGAGSGYSKTAS